MRSNEETKNELTKLSFPIIGMHCASCAKNIERALRKTSGVTDATVNYGSEEATVNFDSSISTLGHLSNVVSGLGYTAVLTSQEESQTPQEIKEAAKRQELGRLKKKVIVSSILSVIIMLGSFPDWFGKFLSFFPYYELITNNYVLLLLATPVQLWAGWEFYQATWSGLKNRAASMDTLIAIGTTAAYGFSLLITFFGETLSQFGFPQTMYFDTAAIIIALILLGRYLEAKAKAHTSDAIKKLLHLQAKTARVLRSRHSGEPEGRLQNPHLERIPDASRSSGNYQDDKEYIDIPIDQVVNGDFIRVRPGEKVPVDGKIVEGTSNIDESMVTGESIPVDKNPGDSVIGSTINKSGSFIFQATKVGNETMLATIVKMVAEAQSSRAPIQRLADVVSSYFVPIVLMLSVATFVVWYDMGSFAQAFTNLIAVLIIACPCALGLATPTAIMVGVGRGAEKGILIKDAQSLEVAHKTKMAIFDKTGTLTRGEPRVTDFSFVESVDQNELAQLIVSVEALSEHPLSRAIVSYFPKQTPIKVDEFRAIEGFGLTGKIGAKTVLIGNAKLMQNEKVTLSPQLETKAQSLMSQGKTLAYVAVNGKHVSLLSIADTLKAEAKETVTQLKKIGVTVWMITGDNERTAQAIAEEAGIENVLAQDLPQDKDEKVTELKTANGKLSTASAKGESVVAFIGDGINDAPALAAADVGIAMGTGTDVAIESASITLLNKDLRSISSAIKLSRATLSIIKQNLVWAFGYNIILIPVAMGALFPFTGWLLNPALAAFAMAASSISVVGNSLRLKVVNI